MELDRLLRVCRLCLKPHFNSITLYSDDSLLKKIDYVLRVPVRQSKFLSSSICSPCYGTVFNFFEYAETVERNQAYLESLLPEVNTDNHSESKKFLPTALDSTTTLESEAEDAPDPEKDVLQMSKCISRNAIEADDRLIVQYVQFHCDVCDKQLNSFQSLNEHCRVEHSTVAMVPCCGKSFRRKDRLLTHILNHVQPEAFKCELCAQICKSKATLHAHRKQHLSLEERAYKCSSCDQRFVSRSQLTNHEVTHVPSDKRKHVCSTCAKTFAFKYVLDKHMKLHNQLCTFICEICAKSFSTEVGLTQHLASHKECEQRPRVKCEMCQQSYKNQNTLRLHVRDKHKDDRVHRCDACKKDFHTRNTLSAHMKYVHVRHIRHACDICTAAFRRRVELREHTAARHTGKALYKCDICDQSFNHSSNYSIHRKNKHPDGEKSMNKRQLPGDDGAA